MLNFPIMSVLVEIDPSKTVALFVEICSRYRNVGHSTSLYLHFQTLPLVGRLSLHVSILVFFHYASFIFCGGAQVLTAI